MKLTWQKVAWKEVRTEIPYLLDPTNSLVLGDMESFAMAGPSHETMGEDKGRHLSILLSGAGRLLRSLKFHIQSFNPTATRFN